MGGLSKQVGISSHCFLSLYYNLYEIEAGEFINVLYYVNWARLALNVQYWSVEIHENIKVLKAPEDLYPLPALICVP